MLLLQLVQEFNVPKPKYAGPAARHRDAVARLRELGSATAPAPLLRPAIDFAGVRSVRRAMA